MKTCRYKFTIMTKKQISSVKSCGKVCFVAVGAEINICPISFVYPKNIYTCAVLQLNTIFFSPLCTSFELPA